MTNLDVIKDLPPKDFINFLKHTDFSGIYPIIYGNRFYSDKEIEDWLNMPNTIDNVNY